MKRQQGKFNKVVSILITIIAFFYCSFFIRISDAEDLNGLIQKLKSKDLTVRKEAIFTLGEIRDSRAVKPLVAILERDNDWDVRAMAEDALVKIGAPAVDLLMISLKDDDWRIRTRAARALGAIKDSRAVDPLITAMKKDKVDTVRRFAAQALGEINDSRVVQALNDAFENKNFEIIAGAYRFFIRRGEPRSEDVLIGALNKYWTRKMIIDFLNSGNGLLKDAAFELAKRHVPAVRIALDATGPMWGDESIMSRVSN